MNFLPLNIRYQEPLFRPPSEAYSLIFQVTLGCSWNRCSFCVMYPGKKFKPRKQEEILAEIRGAAVYAPRVRKVFLADGNAMVLPFRRLLEILETIKENFPSVGRVSSYALPRDILSKTPRQLSELKEAGLQLIYVGVESGDDGVLQMVHKGESAASTVEGLRKAQEAGIKTSVMIVNGLAGSQYSEQHAVKSAEVINKIQPNFFSTLVLTLPQGIEAYQQSFNGNYIHMEISQLLSELEVIIRHTELERTVYRSDHASNIVVLKGVLSRDKARFLEALREAGEVLPQSGYRRSMSIL